MNIIFLLFIIGLVLFIVGYTNSASPSCSNSEQIKYVPRDVYDSLVVSNLLE